MPPPLAASLPQQTTIGQQVTVQISSAQLLALGTTPIQILPAPGANKYYIPLNFVTSLVAGSNNYVLSGGNIILSYGNPVNDILAWIYSVEPAITSAVNAVSSTGYNSIGLGLTAVSQFLNKPLNFDINLGGQTLTRGDGSVVISLTYQTRTFPN